MNPEGTKLSAEVRATGRAAPRSIYEMWAEHERSMLDTHAKKIAATFNPKSE